MYFLIYRYCDAFAGYRHRDARRNHVSNCGKIR
jgi:hypothetical protein